MNKRKALLLFSSVGMAMLTLFALQSHALEISDINDYLNPGPEKTISMDFINANLNDVLKMFSQQSGLNFIAATDVASKKINLYLEDVPVEEALERILSANNLTYEIKSGSNIFVVNELRTSAKQLMTRVYPLKYASVPSSKLNSTLLPTEGSSGGSSSASTGSSSSGIIAAVWTVLTADGTVAQDTRTNSLIVSDIPSQFPLIEQTISRLDIRVPQILIEAEMLDISKNTADLLGAKFGDTPVTFTGAQRDHLYPFNQNNLLRKGFEFEEEYRVGTLSFQGLAVTLQFLRTQTDTRNLARPRILTLNNDTAEISISTSEAIGLSSSTTAAEGTAVSINEAERVETGVFLRVTPQANVATREITMAIEPKVIQARTGATFSGQTFKDPEVRGSKSVLRVNDGDTIVLGGLLRTDFEKIRTSVPVLGKIPFLGAAFRHKDQSESQRELIIFITPHIIEDHQTSNVPVEKFYGKTREQTAPSDRKQAVEKELSFIEQQKRNSYR